MSLPYAGDHRTGVDVKRLDAPKAPDDRKLRRRDYYVRTLRTARVGLHRQRPRSDAPDPNEFVAGVADEDDSRLTVNVGDGEMDRTTTATWQALRQRNDPPMLFRFGTVLGRIEATVQLSDSRAVASVLKEYLGLFAAKCV